MDKKDCQTLKRIYFILYKLFLEQEKKGNLMLDLLYCCGDLNNMILQSLNWADKADWMRETSGGRKSDVILKDVDESAMTPMDFIEFLKKLP